MAAWDDVLPEKDRLVYEKGGWGQPRPRGEKPAIIVIDAMYTFTGDHPEPILDSIEKHWTSCGETSWDGVAAIADLLEVARPQGLPVFYTVMERRADGMFMGGKGRLPQSGQPTNLIGSYANEVVKEIAPGPADVVFTKPKPSAFFGTPLNAWLNELRADTVILTGCVTSGCIRAAALDASSLNYKVLVPEECVWDRGELPHKINLFDIQMKMGDVIGLEETKDWILSLPERPLGDKTLTQRDPDQSQLPVMDEAPRAGVLS